MKSQTSDTERDKLIKDDIKMKIYKIIKQNERISNNLKKKLKTFCGCVYIKMDLYCIKCQKFTNNATDVKLRHETDEINKLYSK